jgi:hypothetical protein
MFRDIRDIIEPLKLIAGILLLSTVYGFVQDEDYHRMFDKPVTIRYNCDMLLGGWHPDVPTEVIDGCRKLKENNVKTNQK